MRDLVCYEDEEERDEDDVRLRRREYVDCPVRVDDTDDVEPSSRRSHRLV